jgi:hypothetical protein
MPKKPNLPKVIRTARKEIDKDLANLDKYLERFEARSRKTDLYQTIYFIGLVHAELGQLLDRLTRKVL